MNSESFTAERIKAARMKMGISQSELARRVGIAQAWLCRIEGAHQAPTIGTLLKLAKALSVTIDYLCNSDSVSVNHNKKKKRKSNAQDRRTQRNGG